MKPTSERNLPYMLVLERYKLHNYAWTMTLTGIIKGNLYNKTFTITKLKLKLAHLNALWVFT